MSERSNRHLDTTPVFICRHVFEGRPVLLISRADGDWQLVCGAVHADENEFAMAHLGHVLDADPSLEEILDVPEDFDAEREAVGAPWMRRPS